MQIKNESAKQNENLNGFLKIDQAAANSHIDSVVRNTVEETLLINCSMQRLISYARLSDTSEQTVELTPEPAITNAIFIPRPVKLSSRFQGCVK